MRKKPNRSNGFPYHAIAGVKVLTLSAALSRGCLVLLKIPEQMKSHSLTWPLKSEIGSSLLLVSILSDYVIYLPRFRLPHELISHILTS